MISLVARDALSEQVVCMNAAARPGDLARRPNRGVVCAVFDESADGSGDEGAGAESFLGLVPAYQIAGNSGKTFAELLPEEPCEPVGASASLPEVLKKMRVAQVDAFAVVDENFRFLGVITQPSIIAALLKREQELLKKSREYRNSVQDDKRRRYDTVRRLEQMNHAFRKMLGLVARPPGRELFQRGVEALALALRASYAAVHIPDGRIRSQEAIATGTPPGPPDSNHEKFFEERAALIERVIRDNRVLSINDMNNWSKRGAKGGNRSSLSSFLGVPISRDRHVFGCVYFCDKPGEPFTDDDEVLATSFAQGLGLVLAQARESAGRKRAERERDLLSHLGLELSGADTLEEVARIVREITEEQWSWDSFSLRVRRSGRTRFRAVMEIDYTPKEEMAPLAPHDPATPYEMAPPPTRIADQRELNARLLVAGEALLVNRTPEDPGPDLERFGEERDSNSMVFAPVRVKGEVHGVLSVQSYRVDYFTDNDRNLLQKMADAIAPAIARCQAEVVGRALVSLGFRLSTATEPGEVGRIIVATADEILGWDACSVDLHDSERRVSENITHMDLVDGCRTEVNSRVGTGPPSLLGMKAIEGGPRLILRDKPEFDTDSIPFGDMARPSMSIMMVPLRTHDRVTGLLSIQSYTEHAYDEQDLTLLQALADHCSGALERTRLQRLQTGKAAKPSRRQI